MSNTKRSLREDNTVQNNRAHSHTQPRAHSQQLLGKISFYLYMSVFLLLVPPRSSTPSSSTSTRSSSPQNMADANRVSGGEMASSPPLDPRRCRRRASADRPGGDTPPHPAGHAASPPSPPPSLASRSESMWKMVSLASSSSLVTESPQPASLTANMSRGGLSDETDRWRSSRRFIATAFSAKFCSSLVLLFLQRDADVLTLTAATTLTPVPMVRVVLATSTLEYSVRTRTRIDTYKAILPCNYHLSLLAAIHSYQLLYYIDCSNITKTHTTDKYVILQTG